MSCLWNWRFVLTRLLKSGGSRLLLGIIIINKEALSKHEGQWQRWSQKRKKLFKISTRVTFFGTLFYRRWTISTWNLLILKMTISFYLFWIKIRSWRIPHQQHSPIFDSKWTRLNKCDKVWDNANWHFNWRFRCCRRRRHLSCVIKYHFISHFKSTIIF